MQKNYTCSVCHKVQKMRGSNKILQLMLDHDIMFDCNKCQRFWLFKDYKDHSKKGQCKLDPSAPNHIDKIKIKHSVSE